MSMLQTSGTTLSSLVGGPQGAGTWLYRNVVNHSLRDPEATISSTFLVLHRAYKSLLLAFIRSIIIDWVKPDILLRDSFDSSPPCAPSISKVASVHDTLLLQIVCISLFLLLSNT